MCAGTCLTTCESVKIRPIIIREVGIWKLLSREGHVTNWKVKRTTDSLNDVLKHHILMDYVKFLLQYYKKYIYLLIHVKKYIFTCPYATTCIYLFFFFLIGSIVTIYYIGMRVNGKIFIFSKTLII